jgi:hypothetical protein
MNQKTVVVIPTRLGARSAIPRIVWRCVIITASMEVELFPTMPTRPCSFCLSFQGGSVFADFDTDDANIISLRRISFDGYGCCEVGESITRMSSGDSRLLLDAIARGELGTVQVEETLRKYFRENKDVIWSDALAEHDLL